jgi:hypothetical protein
MHNIISRADGIRYTTPEIESIRSLLLDTPEEKFVQMQLKAVRRRTRHAPFSSLCDGARCAGYREQRPHACRAHHHPPQGHGLRALRRHVHLREVRPAAHARGVGQHEAALVQQGATSPSSRSSAEPCAGVCPVQEELAAGMHFHTKNSIHASLTQMESRYRANETTCSRSHWELTARAVWPRRPRPPSRTSGATWATASTRGLSCWCAARAAREPGRALTRAASATRAGSRAAGEHLGAGARAAARRDLLPAHQAAHAQSLGRERGQGLGADGHLPRDVPAQIVRIAAAAVRAP